MKKFTSKLSNQIILFFSSISRFVSGKHENHTEKWMNSAKWNAFSLRRLGKSEKFLQLIRAWVCAIVHTCHPWDRAEKQKKIFNRFFLYLNTMFWAEKCEMWNVCVLMSSNRYFKSKLCEINTLILMPTTLLFRLFNVGTSMNGKK